MPKAPEKAPRRRSRSVDPYTLSSVTGVVTISRFGELPRLDEALETLTRALFNEAFARSGGNLSETGRLLGISRSRASDLKMRLAAGPARARNGRTARVSAAKLSETPLG